MMKKSVENGKKPIEMRSEDLSLNELFPRFVAAKTAECWRRVERAIQRRRERAKISRMKRAKHACR